MKLQTKLILLICLLILVVILLIGVLFEDILTDSVEEQIGQKALKVAETVALIPEIRNAFAEPEPWKTIQPIVEDIRGIIEAEYIVIGNELGIRYSHPIVERIGKEMVGGDNGPVLEGRSIISHAVGSMGPALRGKTPIFDDQGQVIGIVSVGFLMEDILAIEHKYRMEFIITLSITVLLAIVGSVLIARSVKKAIFGLEPNEIGRLYQEKEVILESIREGILAVNREGYITMANQTSYSILGLPEGTDLQGKYITEVLQNSRLPEVLKTGKSEYDQEMLIGDREVVVNRIPILDRQQQVIGAVSSFRYKSELYRLTQELSQVKSYAEALRAITHEHSNKLYLISGLLQLGSHQEAIDLITHESGVHQSLLHFIMREIPDPMIGGILIGKFNRAKELRVQLEINRESSFRDLPASIDRSDLVTILGNLIDNAMEAVLEANTQHKGVTVFLTDLGADLIIEIEDTGQGIPEDIGEAIFEYGFSTKETENRGVGLHLVKRAVEKLNGYLTYTSGSDGGTFFTVAIPKKRPRHQHSLIEETPNITKVHSAYTRD